MAAQGTTTTTTTTTTTSSVSDNAEQRERFDWQAALEDKGTSLVKKKSAEID